MGIVIQYVTTTGCVNILGKDGTQNIERVVTAAGDN